MNRGREAAAALGLLLVVGGFAWGVTGVHAFGNYNFRYGAIVAKDAVPNRAATNSVVVTAFDYRAFDTLGEEFILFISVVGVVVLLRRLRGEEEDENELDIQQEHRGSESVRWLGGALVAPVFVLGAYVVTHGALSPGGGFQGGVVLMSALASVFLGGEYVLIKRVRGVTSPLELLESIGAAAFAMLGFGGLIAGGAFFYNFINKGTAGLLTGGFIPLANIFVGVEVACALLIISAELLYQRLVSAS
jgi:multicomponent Na+:H+ antiporter subunit B